MAGTWKSLKTNVKVVKCGSEVPTADLSSGRNLFAQFLGQQNNIVVIKAKLAPSTPSDTSTVDLRGAKWAIRY
jgi:hypothetical protein